MLHVNEKVKLSEEIGTQDGLLYISKDEDPAKGTSKSKVKCKRAGTVCRYGGTVGSLQGQTVVWTSALSARRWKYAHLCTGIHKKAEITRAVSNVKHATMC